jgi:hypothetical protein
MRLTFNHIRLCISQQMKPLVACLIQDQLHISIYVEPTTDPNLNQSIRSFFENTKDESSYHILSSTLINLTNQILQAYQVAFYDYSNEKSTKMLEVWLVKEGYRYLLVYGSEPGRFDTYLHFAQKMIDSLGDKQYFRPAPTTNESINAD